MELVLKLFFEPFKNFLGTFFGTFLELFGDFFELLRTIGTMRIMRKMITVRTMTLRKHPEF